MSDTPRTDEVCKNRNCAYFGVPRHFTAQLERELTITLSERDALRANFQEYRDRAESAEAQVAALTEALRRLDHSLGGNEEEILPAISHGRSVLSTLPDRAKKIQAVVEAAKHHEQIWRQKCDQGDRIKCGCGICQAVRDLESKETP